MDDLPSYFKALPGVLSLTPWTPRYTTIQLATSAKRTHTYSTEAPLNSKQVRATNLPLRAQLCKDTEQGNKAPEMSKGTSYL